MIASENPAYPNREAYTFCHKPTTRLAAFTLDDTKMASLGGKDYHSQQPMLDDDDLIDPDDGKLYRLP